MKKQMLLLIMVGMLIGTGTVEATYTFGDGRIHNIDYLIDTGVLVENQTIINIYTGGRINGTLMLLEDSQVTLYGGTIEGGPEASLIALDQSHITIYGGSIISGYLIAQTGGGMTIYGSDFAVDGEPFGYGELTSILGGNAREESFRRLTGTLANGEFIDINFQIGHDSKIVLTIPAPGAIILGSLGVGLVGWLRRTVCLFD